MVTIDSNCPPGKNRACNSINLGQVAIGVLFMLFGALAYVTATPAEHSILRLEALSLHLPVFSVPHKYVTVVPTFSHVAAVSLLTAAVLATTRRGAAWVCLSWASIEALFALGQHEQINAWLVSTTPSWLNLVGVQRGVGLYISDDGFAASELIAILFGAAIAYAIIIGTQPEKASEA